LIGSGRPPAIRLIFNDGSGFLEDRVDAVPTGAIANENHVVGLRREERVLHAGGNCALTARRLPPSLLEEPIGGVKRPASQIGGASEREHCHNGNPQDAGTHSDSRAA